MPDTTVTPETKLLAGRHDALDEELLIILGEESAEIIQETSKCYRFTPDSKSPIDGTTPRDRLTIECGDWLAVIRLLVKRGVIDNDAMLAQAKLKVPKVIANLRNAWVD